MTHAASVSRIVVICFVLVLSCSCAALFPFALPTVNDERLEAFIADEAAKILQVSEKAHKAALYRFQLVDFPRKDILGLSLGSHQIFISYELGRLALEHKGYLWLLRQTLAHEIAHDVLGKESAKQEPGLNSVPRSSTRITGQDLGLPAIITLVIIRGTQSWRRIRKDSSSGKR